MKDENMGAQPLGEQLILYPKTLAFYIDEAGDERLDNRERPIFAFGGVAAVAEDHPAIARAWKSMKTKTFPQVRGALHAKTHLRDRLSEKKRRAVLAAMEHPQLGRFATVLTSETLVLMDQVVRVACCTLANRLTCVAQGLVNEGAWNAPGRVVAIFEHSSRLAQHIEMQFPDQISVGGCSIQVKGCFMPKSVANPFLEMADFVASIIGKNIIHQQQYGRAQCTPNFQALFRDVGPPLANYLEVTEVV
jgi:Protein of unknown function (DUF3800)